MHNNSTSMLKMGTNDKNKNGPRKPPSIGPYECLNHYKNKGHTMQH